MHSFINSSWKSMEWLPISQTTSSLKEKKESHGKQFVEVSQCTAFEPSHTGQQNRHCHLKESLESIKTFWRITSITREKQQYWRDRWYEHDHLSILFFKIDNNTVKHMTWDSWKACDVRNIFLYNNIFHPYHFCFSI